MSNLIIFDLDGVITSEEAYWDTAGLTLHELMYSPRYWGLGAGSEYHPATTARESRRVSRAIFPETEILTLKARAINSNWDTCYAATCLHLIDLLGCLKKMLRDGIPAQLLPPQPWEAGWIAAFREQIAGMKEQVLFTGTSQVRAQFFDAPVFHGYIGLELINRLDAYASELLGYPIEGVFSRLSPFWAFCRDVFQEWYLGDELYTETYGHSPAQAGKPGCIHFGQPLLPVEQIRGTLESLRQHGYVLGFATGRVHQEAVYPLKMYGLLEYFDEQRISTYDYVERAEAWLRAHGDQTLLSKPHPFPFLVAADTNLRAKFNENVVAPLAGARPSSIVNAAPVHGQDFVVIGDSTSDILGGRAAGALTIAVLTGARTPEARDLLARSKPDFIIEDITKLPALLASIDSLAIIQRLQFSEREKAERLLQRWFARHMNLAVESVSLTPRAVSLNSFNGFYRSDGEEFFFKTHVEEQGVIEEYYNAALLYEAGYNIVRPLRTLHEEGRQMVIYPVVRWPVMFDLVRAVETGGASEINIETLALAEKQECRRLRDIYRSTLAFSPEEEHARAPIHQLFWHRLAGSRFKSLYTGKTVPLPGSNATREVAIPFDELLTYHWVINGVTQRKTLHELVERAKVVLNPVRAAMTIIGHGDAHFGNVFLESTGHKEAGLRYLYFDPAFAGRHSPLLDVIKPLFHNVFAMWMYFPQDIARSLQLSVSRHEMMLNVEHNYMLTPVRRAIVQTKIEHLLTPLIEELRSQEALPADWPEMMRLALMCCALLTINLLDRERMPAAITWLGLSQAIEMGNSGIEAWRIEV
jgi:phosphoglycolate phosphatase-like HAD superfamily hydrolase